MMKQEEIRKRLLELAEPKYRDFSKKLTPGARDMLGVRIPELRKLAGQIAKEDWRAYLREASDESFEEIMLQGMVIGYAKMPLEEFCRYIEEFVPKIDNWSVNDCVCSTLKMTRKHRDEMWEFLMRYRDSDDEFRLRFLAVMLMDYYLTDEYIDRVLEIYGEIRHEGYYTKMGVAWGVATAYAKYPQKTDAFFREGKIDGETEHMAVRKMLESYRVSDEDKARYREAAPGKVRGRRQSGR